MSNSNNGLFANLKNDLPAGIVVFLVAVPLCLGIALASGAPPLSGIIAGIVGGIVVTAFSGSSLGVSGPAAGLAAIVLTAIPALGGFEVFLLAVVIAGVFQFLLGVAKAGIIGYYFPTSVIKGMLAGIGVIIFLKQIPHAFGYDKDPAGDVAFVQADGQNTFSELLNMIDYITPGALVITVVSLAILILWETKFIKKNGIEGMKKLLTFPDFSHWNNPAVYATALTLAVVASLETLLCVEATDKLDPQKRITPTNKELRAQGIGNVVSGLIGGLPVTQVIVRSSANIQSGGKSRGSAFFHGLLILVCVLSIPALLNMIPLASLAAILLVVGYKLAKPSLFKAMYAKGWTEFIPFIVTIVGIVLTDLLTGIGLGMAVAIFFILYKNYRKPFFLKTEDYKPGKLIHLQLSESVSFLNKGSILRSLDQLPDGSKVLIDGSETRDIHPDVIEIIDDFKANALTREIDVATYGLDTLNSMCPIDEFKRAVVPQSKKTQSKKVFKSINKLMTPQ